MKKIIVRKNEIPIEIMSTMGCRTQNGADISAIDSYKNNIKSVIKEGVLKDNFISAAQKDGRGNCCPVTIILPTLAMEAIDEVWDKLPKDSKERITVSKYNWCKNEIVIEFFMDLLDRKIHEAKDMLIERYEWICSQPIKSARFMYENGLGIGFDGKTIRSVMKHFTLALGQLGIAETLQILIGCDHTDPRGMKLAKRIEQLFYDRCKEFKEKYRLNIGLYYSPECKNKSSVGAFTVM